MSKSQLPAIVLCAVVAGFLFGQEPPAPMFDVERAFRLADSNGDDRLSREEFNKYIGNRPQFRGNPERARQVFNRLDANKDGYLSFDEFERIVPVRGGANAVKQPSAPAFNERPSEAQLAFFEKKIRPILVEHCHQCHAADAKKIKGGLLVDSRDGVRNGGDTGPAIVPGEPAHSPLIQALHHPEKGRKMPPERKLPASVIADLEQWVRMGAPDPRTGKSSTASREIDLDKGRQFWAFQPPRNTAPPAVRDVAWSRTEIDRFLLAALETRGLRPVADADPGTLLRRLHFDLTGLPPEPAAVETWLHDPSPEAYHRVVDQLLQSPAFGERWGRHWLDVARYAESTGKQVNFNYPHAWRYRDYVIAAFNADKPFHRFIREQLAGDLLPAADELQRAEQLIATGFLAIGPKVLNERRPLQFQMDLADEQIDVTTQAFLGLTAACARCHDHKFDPIPMRDYYALAGVFRSTETCYGTIRLVQANQPAPLVPLPAKSEQPAGLEPLTPAERKRMEQQRATLEQERDSIAQGDPRKLNQTMAGIRTQARLAALQSRLALYEADGMPRRLAMGARDRFRMVDSPVFLRGEIDKPGTVVPRGVLQVVGPSVAPITKSSGRRELAEWIASRENPLTARVMVNRIWLHLFGRGLVPTPDNFGTAGQPPTHPELLDHLAVMFMDDGWSVKKLIRRIVLSRAYQLSSAHDPANYAADPDNALVWRRSKRRLEAEALRDAMLAVSGQLDREPPHSSPVTRGGDGYTQGLLAMLGPALARFKGRSVYLPVLREMLPESLSLFDMADPSMVVAERAVTTVPAQGLYLLNNPFVMQAAAATAENLLHGPGTNVERIRHAYLRFYGRVPTSQEIGATEAFLKEYRATLAKDGVAEERRQRNTWAAFCQALFASAEFLYVN